MAPGLAFVVPVLTMARSGPPEDADGFWIPRLPSDGLPPRLSELPVKRWQPAASRARNSTSPGAVLVKFNVNVYDQTSWPGGALSAGADVMTTLADGVKVKRFWIPGSTRLPAMVLV